MRRARSVSGPLRRAHPASGATWNVQVVRGKMSSTCLWHACRALSAGLLLMLLGSAMAIIGYYADTLSVDQEIRGNATISVKDEARGFHLNNLSYAGPIVMGFGGFIVVAACVMTFEARDSAAKVTPARPQALPAVARAPGGAGTSRRTPAAAGGHAAARLDALGLYRAPLHAPPPPHRHRHMRHAESWRDRGRSAGGSAPDLRVAGAGAAQPLAATALRRPLRRYALSVDEAPQTHSVLSASAAESECGSQSSLALELHGAGAGGGDAGGGGGGGVTLRVRDSSRRRQLSRQQRLPHDDTAHAHHPHHQTLQIAPAKRSNNSSIDETERHEITEHDKDACIAETTLSEKAQSPLSRHLSPPTSPLETIVQEVEEPEPPDRPATPGVIESGNPESLSSIEAVQAGDSLSSVEAAGNPQDSLSSPSESELTEILVQPPQPLDTVEFVDET